MRCSKLWKGCGTLIALACAHDAVVGWAVAQQITMKVQIVASDMCCQGCAQNVAAQLYAAPGVTSVEADVASRTVTVTAKPSPKLTPQRLWLAVEQGKGGPTKLITSQATYTWTRSDAQAQEARLPAGQYAVVFQELNDRELVQRIADQIYKVRGVANVGIDSAQHAIVVQTSGNALSPWTLAAAAEQAQAVPIAVRAPNGQFTIERITEASRATAARPTNTQTQGGVR